MHKKENHHLNNQIHVINSINVRVLNKLGSKEVCSLTQYFQIFDHFGIKVGV